MTRLRASTVLASALREPQHRQMFAVFSEYYAEVSFENFLRDLSAKDDVILLLDPAGAIQGFSTMKNLALTVRGRRVNGLFSGDTVVAKAYWGQRVLGRAFLRYLFAQKARHPLAPYYWFLISKGYKTYLLMANNFEDHHPRMESEMTRWDRAVLDAFATSLYPHEYDPASGLVTFRECHGHLRRGVADITPELRSEVPRVDFFEAKNPTWAEGTELACIARMTWSMPFKYALKARARTAERLVPKRRAPARVPTSALAMRSTS